VPSNTFSTTSAHHPALSGLSRPTVLLGHTERYEAIAQAISLGSAARFNFQVQRLDLAASDTLAEAIETCDLYLFFYDASTLPNPRAEGPDFIRALHGVMAEHWKNPAAQGLWRLLLRHLQRRPTADCRPQRHG